MVEDQGGVIENEVTLNGDIVIRHFGGCGVDGSGTQGAFYIGGYGTAKADTSVECDVDIPGGGYLKVVPDFYLSETSPVMGMYSISVNGSTACYFGYYAGTSFFVDAYWNDIPDQGNGDYYISVSDGDAIEIFGFTTGSNNSRGVLSGVPNYDAHSIDETVTISLESI